MRTDGRACDDYRHMDIETDVVSNAAGSARLRLVSIAIRVLINNVKCKLAKLEVTGKDFAFLPKFCIVSSLRLRDRLFNN
jgi:ribonuclease PH